MKSILLKTRNCSNRVALAYRKRRAIKRMNYVAFLTRTLESKKEQLAQDDALRIVIKEETTALRKRSDMLEEVLAAPA